MNLAERERMFSNGMALCRNGRLPDAAGIFRRLVDSGSREPLHLSYCGLLTATVHGLRREGRNMCEEAARLGPDEPETILNLVRLYETTGEVRRAVKALRRGLRARPGHPALLKQIDRLSPRRRPPLSMVARNHFLNRKIAILLAKLGGYYGRGETG